MIRIYKIGLMVFFIQDSSFEGVSYPNTIVRLRFANERIQFYNAQNESLLKDVRRRDMDYAFGDVRKEDGTPYGGTLTETVEALAAVINFSVVSGGGGSTDLSDVYAQLALKTPYLYVNESIAAVTGTPIVTLNTLEKIALALDNNPNFAQTVFSAIAGKASISDVNTAVANLVGQSPEMLDTLEEIAAALGDDPNFATTMMTALGVREVLENKAANFTIVDNIKYPTTQAVVTYLAQYVTANALTAALANYVTTATLTTALAGKADTTHTHLRAHLADRIQARITLNAPTTTDVLVANTFVKISGATTPASLLNANAPQDNRIVVEKSGDVSATLWGNFTGTNNVTYAFAIAKNGAIVASVSIRVTVSAQPFAFALTDIIPCVANDFLEAFVSSSNSTADPNITKMHLLLFS